LFSYINLVLWQHVILCKLYVTESAPGYVYHVLCNWRLDDLKRSKHVGAILNVLMWESFMYVH